MKIAITVSETTPSGGLSKYIYTLADILTNKCSNEIWIIVTHLSKVNHDLEELSKNKNINICHLGDFSLIKKYTSLILTLRKINPDVIINNYNAPTQYILPFLKKRSKIIHILHSCTNNFYRLASINAYFVDNWIAPTPAIRNYFNEYTKQKYRNRVAVIPHGVPSPIDNPIKSHNRLHLVFIGALYEHKGVKILPNIIKRLLDKQYNFHFTFIGDGPLRKELENELKTEVERNCVWFTGNISSKNVYTQLLQSDILVYPTHIDAFGLVIAEAMIHGCIPVTTHLKGITDSLIDDGVNGFLIPMDRIDIFVDRISQLIEDKNLRTTMSNAATRKASACFSLDVMRKHYTTFINKIIE